MNINRWRGRHRNSSSSHCFVPQMWRQVEARPLAFPWSQHWLLVGYGSMDGKSWTQIRIFSKEYFLLWTLFLYFASCWYMVRARAILYVTCWRWQKSCQAGWIWGEKLPTQTPALNWDTRQKKLLASLSPYVLGGLSVTHGASFGTEVFASVSSPWL